MEENSRPEWIAQFLLEPPEPLPPGTYCSICAHSEPAYLDRMFVKGEYVPACPRKDCGCGKHMVDVYVKEE